ncbi:alpha/beta fold hydrolase [Sulfobacillus sp. hq2]|uniref:alpha/beta fold hydrolase n=1 Tax=Sulfobacillus TaxID=28033 RepID=UPI001FA8729B|nr:alpha/beta hydrolase [Sulfobacillus sp. hq2]
MSLWKEGVDQRRMRTATGLTYYVYGKGHEAVLCHPSLGLGRFLFHRMVPALSREFVMVTWDPRGIGDHTEWQPTMSDWVHDVADIVQALNMPVHLLGVSLGTWVMARAAVQNPSGLVRSLTVIGATLGFYGQEADVSKRQQQLETNGMAAFAREYAHNTLTMYASGEIQENLALELGSCNVQRYLEAMRIIYTESNERIYPAVSVPTLVMVGALDTRTDAAQADAVCQLLPQGTLKVLPRSGHLALLDQPDRVHRECRYFWQHGVAADD